MSLERDAVLPGKHVPEDMGRKVLDSPPVRASLIPVESSTPPTTAGLQFGTMSGAWTDAKQVELLATRRRIVSTTYRPREAEMA